MAKIQFIETDEIPVCPYCEKELSEIHANPQKGWRIEKNNICFCPHCRKVLGIAFSRGAL